MIEATIDFLVRQLNQYLKVQLGNNGSDWVTASAIVDQHGIPGFEHVTLSLISVEEERANKSQNPFHKNPDGNGFEIVNPEIKLNLYLMVAAHFGVNGDNYKEALKFLSYAVTYFQGTNVFTQKNAPDLDPSIERLIMDLISPSFGELHNIWGYIGAKYIPSVMYKARLITVQQDRVRATVTPVQYIEQTDQKLNS